MTNNHKTIAGAVTDFAAYLTTREEPITLSCNHTADGLVELVEAWATLRGLDITQADALSWEDCLKPETDPKQTQIPKYF